MPPGAPLGMKRAGSEIAGQWEPGWVVYGIPIGSDRYVAHMLDSKVKEVAQSAARACEVLEGESQALWSVLRLSVQQQFGYWLSLVHPSQIARAADRVDTILWGVLESISGVSILTGGEGLLYTCPMEVGVEFLEGK